MLVRSVAARPPPPPGKFVSKEPSPTNLLAVIDDAVICCDDTNDAKSDLELIFIDEIVLKLLRYPVVPSPVIELTRDVVEI